jgi:hypothetical protein
MIFTLLLLSAFSVAEIWILYKEYYIASALSVIVALAGSYFLFNEFQSFVTFVGWKTVLTWYVPMYIGAGVLTALVKWFSLHVHIAMALKKIKGKKLYPESKEGLDPLVKKISESDDRHIKFALRGRKYTFSMEGAYSLDDLIHKIAPVATDNVYAISAWIINWPYVVVHAALFDVLLKFGRWVSHVFDYVFGSINRAIIKQCLK